MGMEESIKKLFVQLVKQHGGNKAKAARSIGVDPPTFWCWITGKRSFNPALCQAIDRAGGVLLLPKNIISTTNKNIDSVKVQQESQIYCDFIALLEAAIKQEGNAAKLGETLGICPNLLTRWRSKSRVPTLSNIQPVLDYWGARLVWSESFSQENESCSKIKVSAGKDTGGNNSSKILELHLFTGFSLA